MSQPPPSRACDIHLTLTSTRPLGAAASAGLERWQARAAIASDGAAPSDVGTVAVLALDLLRCDDPWGALDASNDDIAHIGDTVFDEMTGQLSEALDSRLARRGSRVLVLDRVELAPAWRGHNIAALLVAETLDRLRADVRVALCLPGPLQQQSSAQEEDETSLRRMQRVWSQVGFSEFRDGVWLLEPNQGQLDEHLSALRERHEVSSRR